MRMITDLVEETTSFVMLALKRSGKQSLPIENVFHAGLLNLI
jgi:hypothetical protein